MIQKYYDEEEGLYGYKNEEGIIIIPADFDETEDFSYGVAAVRKDNNWGLINEKGETVIPCAYESIYTSRDGWVHAEKDNDHFLFSKEGVLQLQVQDILSWYYPEEGIIRAIKESGWGYFDMQGDVVIPFIYKSLGPCLNGWISYYDDGKWGWLDKEGYVRTPAIFDEVGIWDKEYWWARKERKYTIFDYAGAIVCNEGWMKIVPPVSGQAAVKTEKGWKYINPDFTTRLQLPPVYDWVEVFIHGFAAVKRDNAWGFINTDGKEVIQPVYKNVSPFSEGLAAVEKDKLWGYINQAGEIVIPCTFMSVHSFKNGKARVHSSYYAWHINPKGEQVSEKEELDWEW